MTYHLILRSPFSILRTIPTTFTASTSNRIKPIPLLDCFERGIFSLHVVSDWPIQGDTIVFCSLERSDVELRCPLPYNKQRLAYLLSNGAPATIDWRVHHRSHGSIEGKVQILYPLPMY